MPLQIAGQLEQLDDNNFQTLYSVQKANKKFSKFGFHFFVVEDHHSGSHCPDGLLALINPTDKLQDNINKSLEPEGYINYLKIHDIFVSSF